MFTGIIQTTGTVKNLSKNRITVCAPRKILKDIKNGSSISVDGVCLTVIETFGDGFLADFMPETAKKTIIGDYKTGQTVNIEPALRADGRFEGHIVTGHVDGTGRISGIQKDGNSNILTVKISEKLTRYVVPKGSIAVNGISLTVISALIAGFTVCIIPHTWETTDLRNLKIGSTVNIETDILGKYAEKLMRRQN